MFVSQAFPGEYAQGHGGRVATLNDFVSARHFFNTVRTRLELPPRSELPDLQILTTATGETLPQYLAQHSMLPLTFFQSPIHMWSRRGVIQAHAMTNLRAFAYYCVECITLDEQLRRTSYWHTSNQLPGCRFCARHPETALARVTAEKAFDRPPRYWHDAGDYLIDHHQYDDVFDSWLSRLASVGRAMLALEGANIPQELGRIPFGPHAVRVPKSFKYELGYGHQWRAEGRLPRRGTGAGVPSARGLVYAIRFASHNEDAQSLLDRYTTPSRSAFTLSPRAFYDDEAPPRELSASELRGIF
jgi:hypothetical protein